MISWLHLQLTNWSWDWNCLIMLYFEFWSHDQFVSHKYNHEIGFLKALLGNFDLMIKMSTSWLILLDKFDLMIKMSTSWSILLDKFDLMNKLNFDLMIKRFDPLKKLNFNLMKFDLLSPTDNTQTCQTCSCTNTNFWQTITCASILFFFNTHESLTC